VSVLFWTISSCYSLLVVVVVGMVLVEQFGDGQFLASCLFSPSLLRSRETMSLSFLFRIFRGWPFKSCVFVCVNVFVVEEGCCCCVWLWQH